MAVVLGKLASPQFLEGIMRVFLEIRISFLILSFETKENGIFDIHNEE